MTRAQCLFRTRFFLAILPVVILLAGTWAQASMAFAVPHTIEICSDGVMKTVRVADQDPVHDAGDCRRCPACILPLALDQGRTTDPTFAAAWLPAAYPQPRAGALSPFRAAAPLSRGPPMPRPRT